MYCCNYFPPFTSVASCLKSFAFVMRYGSSFVPFPPLNALSAYAICIGTNVISRQIVINKLINFFAFFIFYPPVSIYFIILYHFIRLKSTIIHLFYTFIRFNNYICSFICAIVSIFDLNSYFLTKRIAFCSKICYTILKRYWRFRFGQ